MVATFTQYQIDTLQELGNIGSGNAATSLSVMLNRPVDIELTTANVTSVKEHFKGHQAGEYTTVIHAFEGPVVKGFIWLNVAHQEADFFKQMIAGDMPIENELVFQEVSNILCGSYIRALCDMLMLKVEIFPPSVCEVEGFLMETTNLDVDSQNMMSIRNRLLVADRQIGCSINLVFDKPSLGQLFTHCGIG